MPRPEHRMKCAVCNHVLNYTEELLNGVVQGGNWTHAQESLNDHPVAPVDLDEGGFGPTILCDFCGQEDNEVAWIECRPFKALNTATPDMVDDDGQWSVCQGCLDVWDQHNIGPLMDRVLNVHLERGQITRDRFPALKANVLGPVYGHVAANFVAVHHIGKEDSDGA